MSHAANMINAGWKTDGLPAHMVRALPLTCEVIVYQQRRHINQYGEEAIMLDTPPQVHQVQLERDGRLLTQADRLPSWRLRRDGDPDG